jgi:antitoxin FitA
MCPTCRYVLHMSKMIQIRHVPDELHRRLKARAALEGLSLSDYLMREVERLAARPTLEELRRRLLQRAPARPFPSPARAVREEREGR